MAAKKRAKNGKGLTFFLSIIAIVIGLVAGLIIPLYVAEAYFTKNIYTDEFAPVETEPIQMEDADISVHFLELGNKYTGDCTLIKVGDVEVLIDCGSRADSVMTVAGYLNNYVSDGKLEYVIITHAHQDHYAGFATPEKMNSIFDLYECETIITFAKTNQKATNTTYKNYLRELNAEIAKGANHYTADKCYNGTDGAQKIYSLGAGYELEILYNAYYWEAASTENDYSVCCMVQGNGKHFLFTGDLEKTGELALGARYQTDHSEIDFDSFSVDLYKAGHHGSKTSSNAEFLQVFKPKICCVCCCAGSKEYTSNKNNQFPTQDFIDRISVYTDKVYITTLCVDYDNNEFISFNGNIVVLAKGSDIDVKCSDNTTPLKDTVWFNENRTCAAWGI